MVMKGDVIDTRAGGESLIDEWQSGSGFVNPLNCDLRRSVIARHIFAEIAISFSHPCVVDGPYFLTQRIAIFGGYRKELIVWKRLVDVHQAGWAVFRLP